MATQPQCTSNSALNVSYQFSCCQEQNILKRTIIYSWHRNYSHCTNRLTYVKIITSKETSLLYWLNLVGLPNDVVSMSNYTYSVDVRMTGECRIERTQIETVTPYDMYPAPAWRDEEKPLKVSVFIYDVSGAIQAEYLQSTILECYHYAILLNCCLQ